MEQSGLSCCKKFYVFHHSKGDREGGKREREHKHDTAHNTQHRSEVQRDRETTNIQGERVD
jgi:hypothetical protein